MSWPERIGMKSKKNESGKAEKKKYEAPRIASEEVFSTVHTACGGPRGQPGKTACEFSVS